MSFLSLDFNELLTPTRHLDNNLVSPGLFSNLLTPHPSIQPTPPSVKALLPNLQLPPTRSGDEVDSRKRKSVVDRGWQHNRLDFLERNRLAAIKCRQKKKQKVQELREKVVDSQKTRDLLQEQVEWLKVELLKLKKELLAHEACGCDCKPSTAIYFKLIKIVLRTYFASSSSATTTTPKDE